MILLLLGLIKGYLYSCMLLLVFVSFFQFVSCCSFLLNCGLMAFKGGDEKKAGLKGAGNRKHFSENYLSSDALCNRSMDFP